MGDTDRHDDTARSTDASAATATLWVVAPAARRQIVTVPASGLTIGREAVDGSPSLILDDVRASRAHAVIRWVRDRWELRDLGSRNGGFVGGVPWESSAQVEIGDGTVIRIGSTVAVFRGEAPLDEHPAAHSAFPGTSNAARAVRARLEKLAKGTGAVLIVGETGSGKERLARAIANQRPIVAVNCSELTRELARSELFGHARGAFSGAVGSRTGLIETAGAGVVFLDEIGELALDVQGELLRFLEDGSFRPVGSNELRTSSARVVAATNVDLDEAVRDGRFRRDLLARLRASNRPLEVPPLRERKEDIIEWTHHFFLEAGNAADPEIWSPGSVECLLLYRWDDNLRELRGVVRGVVEDAPKPPLEPDRLPVRIRDYRLALRRQRTLAPAPPLEPTEQHLRDALSRANGNMRVTAESLGLDRRKLYRLCERLGIDFEAYRKGNVE